MAYDDRTDSDALIEVAQKATMPYPIERGDLVAFPTTPHVVDLEQYGDHPRRKKGSATFTEATSLIAYVVDHAEPGTALYGSWADGRITAVLNGHAPPDGDAGRDAQAGWGDHRVHLHLSATPAWKRWIALDRQPLEQGRFAEHIEDSLPGIVEPDGATLLEITQSFQANTTVAFRTGTRLQTGETRLRYEEQIEARAGAQGDIVIPGSFTLALVPWEGCNAYRMTARLRYRIGNGDLKLTYVLDRPEDVLRAAFKEVTEKVAAETSFTALAGSPR